MTKLKVRTDEEIMALPDTDDTLSLPEAARFLTLIGYEISAKTLSNKLYDNAGPRVGKRGGRRCFRKADLRAWKAQETEFKNAYSA